MNHLYDAGQIKEDILKKMSAREKWDEAFRLRQLAWKIKFAGVKAQHPDWDAGQLHEEVKKIFLYASS